MKLIYVLFFTISLVISISAMQESDKESKRREFEEIARQNPFLSKLSKEELKQLIDKRIEAEENRQIDFEKNK